MQILNQRDDQENDRLVEHLKCWEALWQKKQAKELKTAMSLPSTLRGERGRTDKEDMSSDCCLSFKKIVLR
jgi:hypothetical protein